MNTACTLAGLAGLSGLADIAGLAGLARQAGPELGTSQPQLFSFINFGNPVYIM